MEPKSQKKNNSNREDRDPAKYKEDQKKVEEFKEKLTKRISEKKSALSNLKDAKDIVTEVLKNPPYTSLFDKHTERENYELLEELQTAVVDSATYVHKVLQSNVKKSRDWKKLLPKLDRKTIVSLCNFILFFLRLCGECPGKDFFLISRGVWVKPSD